jgi:hypothetical protein
VCGVVLELLLFMLKISFIYLGLIIKVKAVFLEGLIFHYFQHGQVAAWEVYLCLGVELKEDRLVSGNITYFFLVVRNDYFEQVAHLFLHSLSLSEHSDIFPGLQSPSVFLT